MFNIDFDKLILWLLPTFLRKSRQLAWLKSLCFPIMQLFDDFTNKRNSDLYKLNHNCQVFSIENALNDSFDSDKRRIYITDGFNKDRLYIYTKEELKPIYLGTTYIYNADDYNDTGVDFIVWVPNEIYLSDIDLIEIRSMVNFYKLASKRFRIYRK